MHWYAGTSGYSYKEWKGSFYPADLPAEQMLAQEGHIVVIPRGDQQPGAESLQRGIDREHQILPVRRFANYV